MALNKGKHIVEEIDGVRCSLVEKGVSPTRTEFLKKITRTKQIHCESSC